jgi:hypothetical protein
MAVRQYNCPVDTGKMGENNMPRVVEMATGRWMVGSDTRRNEQFLRPAHPDTDPRLVGAGTEYGATWYDDDACRWDSRAEAEAAMVAHETETHARFCTQFAHAPERQVIEAEAGNECPLDFPGALVVEQS